MCFTYANVDESFLGCEKCENNSCIYQICYITCDCGFVYHLIVLKLWQNVQNMWIFIFESWTGKMRVATRAIKSHNISKTM